MNVYHALMQRLFTINCQKGMKLGLNNALTLQNIFSFPDRSFATIHIAGTNGKGSVACKIASALQAAGYRTGLFTSPHLTCFRERIRINQEMISEEEACSLLSCLFTTIEKQLIPATFFEITTFLAFLYFQQQQVEVAFIETGIGGRLDTTNIISPKLSFITSISYDHQEILGKTLEEITSEKAGIIKWATPVVIGPRVPLMPIELVAKPLQSKIIQVKTSVDFFEEENRLIAQAALQELTSIFMLSPTAIEQGINKTPACRFEQILGNPLIILDVAHNPDGLQKLFQAIKKKFPNRLLRIVCGLSKSKDYAECLRILTQASSCFHFVEASNGRGVEVEELARCIKDIQPQATIYTETCIKHCIKKGIEQAKQNNEILVICGSFFIMAEVRQALGYQEVTDCLDYNERFHSVTN